ncbi:BTB domain-containing protein [Phanerochaete sordida]|uniref:BTB domain-containing protein n=1 Tax=Phanerochaete sordida TaxID=48140 RepID=A0A9P3LHZ8_9APHY|nr:BTB domain-containing protein [Phanerochaete sordida]
MANVAAPPFNKPSADVILRSCDNVDFHTHKNILSLASSFFETMFSIPQGPEQALSGLPVVEISENSSTLDSLLRLCYPVRDPILGNIDLAGRVLAAAKKYDFTEASDLVAEKLRGLACTSPLEAFSIACRYGDEDLALRAAQIWRGKNTPSSSVFGLFSASREGLEEKWRQSWLSAQFSDTIISQSYATSMKGQISAGPFFRLLQYIKDSNSTISTFTQVPKPAASSLTQVTSTVDSVALSNNYPFNRPNCDLILFSQDAFSFRVERTVLEALLGGESNQDIESILGAPTTNPTSEEALPTITVREDSGTLACLLRLCYPACKDTVLDWSIDQLAGERALRVYRAAQRYGLQSITRAYRIRLRTLCTEEPLRVYCIAIALGIAEEALCAARHLAFSNLRDMYCPELESLPVDDYYRLLKYHHGCHAAIRSMWRTHFPDLTKPPPSPTGSVFGSRSLGSPSPEATALGEARLTLADFDGQDSPGKDTLQAGLLKAFLEREIAAATVPRMFGTGAYRLDWSAVLQTKSKVEEDIEAALQALQL